MIIKYLIISDSYVCTTVDIETVCQKADMILSQTVRNQTVRNKRISELRKWCQTAQPGTHNIQDEFTVILPSKKK